MPHNQLFLLPYAGANKFAYKALEAMFPDDWEVTSLELPGRGTRFTEKLLIRLEDGVQDLYQQIIGKLNTPYAILGHSMGAVLGLLITKKLIDDGFPSPVRLFCSGRSGLWNRPPDPWYLLPRNRFWELIVKLGGLPDPTLVNEELKVLFEPILRADFRLIQEVETRPTVFAPLNIPITVLLGKDDKLTQRPLDWQRYTTHAIDVHYFEGAHFYFIDRPAPLVSTVRQIMEEPVKSSYNGVE